MSISNGPRRKAPANGKILPEAGCFPGATRESTFTVIFQATRGSSARPERRFRPHGVGPRSQVDGTRQ